MLACPAVMVLSGVVAAAWAKYVRKSPYFGTGRGTDPDAVPLTV